MKSFCSKIMTFTMKKSLIIILIPLLCVLSAMALFFGNKALKSNGTGAKSDIYNNKPMELVDSENSSDHVSVKKSVDEYGIDCTLITEGELFDYLYERYDKLGSVVTGPDGRVYAAVDLVQVFHNQEPKPVSFVEAFSDKKAEELFESNVYDIIYLNRDDESFDLHRAKIVEAKMASYWKNNGNAFIYLSSLETNYTYIYQILIGPQTVVVQFSYSFPNTGLDEYEAVRLNLSECSDWMITDGFNIPRNFDNMPAKESAEACLKMYNFYENLLNHFNKGFIRSFIKSESERYLGKYNEFSSLIKVPD